MDDVKLKEIVQRSEQKARKVINSNFKGQVNEEYYIELREFAVEIAFFACHIGTKHFKFDKQMLIEYISEGIGLWFETIDEQIGEQNG